MTDGGAWVARRPPAAPRLHRVHCMTVIRQTDRLSELVNHGPTRPMDYDSLMNADVALQSSALLALGQLRA